MEKKPKQSTWHGGSQIEPAKQMSINNHLIGPEVLSLAEVDVPPEDLVFHKFYTNEMSSKKPKKKKTAEEEAAEDLFNVDGGSDVDGGDESDNEEIENLLDNADQSLDGDGEYDYDDLDKVANEDDEDLIGDVSDGEMEALSDMAEELSDTPIEGRDDGEDDNDIDVGDSDDSDVDEEDVVDKRKRKRNKKSTVSPFARYEDYEHLMEDDDQSEEPSSRNERKSKKHDGNKTEEPSSSKKRKSKKEDDNET